LHGETCFAIDTLLDTMDQYPELISAGIRVLTQPHMWLVVFKEVFIFHPIWHDNPK
jgi:hypothetical protein